jgi:hypothetical protein
LTTSPARGPPGIVADVAPSRAVESAVELPPLDLRAEITPSTLDPDSRTVELLFSTGARVERVNFWTGERYVEELAVTPEAIRLDRLNDKAPLLDSHSAYGIGSQLGVVVPGSARIADGKAYARVRFSKRDEVETVWRDVLDGIVTNVSVGYRVHKYDRTPANEDERTPELRRAVDWEPYEISLVPMGADAGAKVRAADRVPMTRCLIVTRGAAEESMPEAKAAVVDSKHDDETKPDPTERELGVIAERERIRGIIAAAIALGRRRDDPIVKRCIDEGTPLVEAQSLLLSLHRGEGQDSAGPRPGPTGVKVTRDAADSIREGITSAFLHRINPDAFKLDDNARHYRSYSVVRCAEEVLEQAGIRTRHLGKSDVIGLALGLDQRAGYHTTSDFPIILADVANKTLRQQYDQSPPTWLPLARRVQIPDFKPLNVVSFGEAPALKKVLEHGEYTRGTIGEGKEAMQLATYGRIFAVTRQVLVNDDLEIFGRMAAFWARSARNLESDLVWGEILANRAMADTFNLFSTQHANYTATGTKISIDSLGVARAALRRQTAMDGATYMNLSGRYLLVPPGLETIADQFTTAVTPASAGVVNPFAGRLVVISEPRLEGGIRSADLGGTPIAGDALAWYMTASLDQIDMINYGYLDGNDGPVLDTRLGFDIDGVEYKCREDFAAKAVEYRGMYKNAGSLTMVALTDAELAEKERELREAKHAKEREATDAKDAKERDEPGRGRR